MIPLRPGRILERAPAPSRPTAITAMPRLAPEAAPAITPLDPAQAPRDRRTQNNRRQGDRREAQQTAFLDTRSSSGRRRTPGRRAEDQEVGVLYKRISIRA